MINNRELITIVQNDLADINAHIIDFKNLYKPSIFFEEQIIHVDFGSVHICNESLDTIVIFVFHNANTLRSQLFIYQYGTMFQEDKPNDGYIMYSGIYEQDDDTMNTLLTDCPLFPYYVLRAKEFIIGRLPHRSESH